MFEEIVRQTCSCGAVEHNPNTCSVCIEEGDWANTESTMEWIQAHVIAQSPIHFYLFKAFAESPEYHHNHRPKP